MRFVQLLGESLVQNVKKLQQLQESLENFFWLDAMIHHHANFFFIKNTSKVNERRE
jgi:hypothetical protein